MSAVRDDGFARVVTIAAEDPELLRYVVHKGSISVDGVSLTVARIDDAGFDVSLIPETLERTNLGARGGRPARQPRGRRAREVRREAARPLTAGSHGVFAAEGCGIFVLLLAHRYGSRPDGEERSYTELEYDVSVRR